MAEGILMPKQGITVESCIITKWYKQVGDQVKVGDALFGYETDKSTFDCESTAEGEILEIFYGDGEDVPVLVNVCAVGTKGEDVSALRPAAEGAEAPAEEKKEEAPAAAPKAEEKKEEKEITINNGEIKISPRAKALAEKEHIDVRLAEGTGPYGRIVEKDIRDLMEKGAMATSAAFSEANGAAGGTALGGRFGLSDIGGKPATAPTAAAADEAEFEDEKFSGIRRTIAKSMTASLTSMAQLTLNSAFDATDVMQYRAQLKKSAEALNLPNITLNDIVLFAVSRTLLNHKDLNAHLVDGDTMRRFNHVHLGVAVDTPRGLMVPTIRYADMKSLAQISAEAKALAKKAQEGSISPDELTGATFTVSNLGAMGIESFTPVINPPQTGILGVGTLMTRVKDNAGEIKTYQAMGMSLTFDHRALDGAPAARFLKDLCKNLEAFRVLLAM